MLIINAYIIEVQFSDLDNCFN